MSSFFLFLLLTGVYHVERDQCLHIRVSELYVFSNTLTVRVDYDFNLLRDFCQNLNAHLKSESCRDHEFLVSYILCTIHLVQLYPKWWFSKGNPLISGKSRLVKYYDHNLARYMHLIFKPIFQFAGPIWVFP